MFAAKLFFLLALLCLVRGTFADANAIYAIDWSFDSVSSFVLCSFRYHGINHTAEYNLTTAQLHNGPLNLRSVQIDLDIDGQLYHWEHRGDCITDSSICPLPLNRNIHIQETFTPGFNLPDSVWNKPFNQPFGRLTIQASTSLESTFIYAELQLADEDVRHTALPHPSQSNHSSSGPFTSPGHSPAVSWATGIITIALAAASGVAAVLGRAPADLHVKQPPHHSHSPNGNSDFIAIAVAAQGTLATKAVQSKEDSSNASSGTAASNDPVSRMDPIALFLHFQFISTTGLLSLKYPAIYRGFTVNFAWANFMLPIWSFIRAGQRSRTCNLSEFPPGIAGYAAELGISPQDVFIVVYCVFLCACLILFGLSLLVGFALQLNVFLASNDEKKDKGLRWRILWQQMMSNNALRLMHLGLGSLTVFVFWQWTLKCVSPAVIVASTTAFLLVCGPLATVAFLIVRLASRPGGSQLLYTKESLYAKRWGALYNSLDDNKVSFVVLLLISVVFRSAIIAFGQKSGLVQLIALTILESSMCISLFRYKPYYSPGYNRVNYMLKGTSVVSHLLLLPFIDQINLKPSSAQALGIFILIIHSIVAFILFILTVLKLGWGVVWYQKKHIAFETKEHQIPPEQPIPLSSPIYMHNKNQ